LTEIENTSLMSPPHVLFSRSLISDVLPMPRSPIRSTGRSFSVIALIS
jgi:hypothetical protein